MLGALLFGCGGKVVVDEGSAVGAGGVGNASSTTSPASATAVSGTGAATTASGPSCDCLTACSKIQACINGVDCNQLCAMPPSPDILQCVCASTDCNFDKCAGSSGGSGGAGGSGTPGPECVKCTSEQSMNACSMQAYTCSTNPECSSLLQCHQSCNWTYDCNQSCDEQSGFGEGYQLFLSVIGCAVCNTCYNACQSSSLVQYCFDEGGTGP